MNDDEITDEIAMKLAKAMGWKKWNAFSEDKGWIEGDSVFVYHPSGIADSPRWNLDKAANKMIADLIEVVDLYTSRYEEEACPGCHSASQCQDDCWIRALMKKAKAKVA